MILRILKSFRFFVFFILFGGSQGDQTLANELDTKPSLFWLSYFHILANPSYFSKSRLIRFCSNWFILGTGTRFFMFLPPPSRPYAIKSFQPHFPYLVFCVFLGVLVFFLFFVFCFLFFCFLFVFLSPLDGEIGSFESILFVNIF